MAQGMRKKLYTQFCEAIACDVDPEEYLGNLLKETRTQALADAVKVLEEYYYDLVEHRTSELECGLNEYGVAKECIAEIKKLLPK